MAKAVGVDRDKREFGSAVVRDNADTQCLCPLPHANIEVRTAHECGVQAVANSTAFDSFDEGAKRYSYALLEGPSPVIEYVGTMSAQDDGKGGTLASWSSTFVVQGAEEAQVVAHFEALYLTGLQRLKAIIESWD